MIKHNYNHAYIVKVVKQQFNIFNSFIIMPTLIKRLSTTVLFLVMLWLCSCNEKASKESIISDFPRTVQLTKTPITNFQQFCPGSIMLVDSLLIILDNCDDKLFHCYLRKDMKYVGAFGYHGKGPSEFYTPELMEVIHIDTNNIEFMVCETNLNKISSINLKKGLDAEEEFVTSTISLPSILTYPDQLNYVDEKTVVGRCSYCPGRMFIHDIVLDTTGWINFFPPISIPARADKLSELYNSIIKVSKSHEKIVSAMVSFERLDIFSYQGELELSIILENNNPEPDFSDVTKLMSDETYQYYIDLFLSDKYIYALTIDTQQKDLIDNNYKPSVIHIFSWNGEASHKIELDELATRFVVDEKNHKIYTISPLTDNQLISYELPNDL